MNSSGPRCDALAREVLALDLENADASALLRAVEAGPEDEPQEPREASPVHCRVRERSPH